MKMDKRRENPLLKLRKEIYEHTEGLCTLGPGPGGIGVENKGGTEISLILSFFPSPVQNDVIFPEEIQEYGIELNAYVHGIGRYLNKAELESAQNSDVYEIQKIIETILFFRHQPIRVTREECVEAFDIMIREEMEIKEDLRDGETPQMDDYSIEQTM